MSLVLEAPQILRHATIELLKVGWPKTKEEHLPARLLYEAMMWAGTYQEKLLECGMVVVEGRQVWLSNTCVIQVVDEAIRNRFALSEFYVFSAPPASGEKTPDLAGASGFDTLEEATKAYKFHESVMSARIPWIY